MNDTRVLSDRRKLPSAGVGWVRFPVFCGLVAIVLWVFVPAWSAAHSRLLAASGPPGGAAVQEAEPPLPTPPVAPPVATQPAVAPAEPPAIGLGTVDLPLGLGETAGTVGSLQESGESLPSESQPLDGTVAGQVAGAPTAAVPDEQLGLPGWLVEQSIYIPYDHIKEQFERDGRGVYIPYEQFNELWQRAQQNRPAAPAPTVPVEHALVTANSRATLERTLVRVESRVSIEFLRAGWHRVPLGLAGCAVQVAELDGTPCRLLQSADGSFELVHQVSQAGRSELRVQYVLNVSLAGSENRVSWPVPVAAINRWDISIDQPDVDITVLPAVVISSSASAAGPVPSSDAVADGVTEQTSDGSDNGAGETQAMDEGSMVTALLGNAKTIDIRWTPRSLGAEGLAALLSLETDLSANVQANLARLRHQLAINVQRAAIDVIELEVPAGVRIVNVLAEGVKRWQVNRDRPLLRVELFEPRQGDLNLSIETEQDLSAAANNAWPLILQPIQLPGATRQPGKVTLISDKDLRIDVLGMTGLSRVNEAAGGAPFDPTAPLRFAYSTVPYQLNLQVVEWEPAIDAVQRIGVQLQTRRIETETRLLFDVRQRGIFQVPLSVPVELEIVSIRGIADGAYQAVRVEKFGRSEEQPDQVLVQLATEARGPIALVVQTTQALPGPGLIDATAAPVPLSLVWPRVPADFVESFVGQLTLTAPESLELSIDAATAREFRNQANAQTAAADAAGQRFSFEFPEGVTTFGLQASVRKPQVFVDQLTSLTIESGLWRYLVDLDYDVRFNAVPELRVDVPAELASRMRVVSGSLTARAIQPQPDDVEEGRVAWQLSGAKPLLGRGTVQLAWDEVVPEISVGQRASRSVATLRVPNVDRARGQILVKRSELFDVQVGEGSDGLRAIDPAVELFSGRQQQDVAAALEYVGPWQLNLAVSRYELYDLKRSSVPRSLIRAVWLRNQQLSVQALYRVKSVNQRLTVQMPPGFDPVQGFDSTPVRLDGQPVAIERGQGNSIVIPLGNRDRDAQWLLELRYTMPVGTDSVTGGSIPVPTFDDECAVQKTRLILYLPHDWAPLNFGGPWSDELSAQDGPVGILPRRTPEAATETLDWIATATVPVSGLSDFETDGRPFLFSSLAPPAGDAGALQVTTVNVWLFRGLLVGLVLFVGLLLLRATWSWRAAVVALGVGLWLIAGVWWPFAVQQMEYSSLTATGGLVLALWLVSGVLSLGNRFRARHNGNPRPTPPSGAAVSPATTQVSVESTDGQEQRDDQ